MINNNRILLAVSVLSIVAGALYGPRLLASAAPAREYAAQANWVEQALTVPEQARRADLVVRARVVSLENRVHTEVLPVYAEDAVTVLEERESRTPFTDATFEVVETFKGTSAPFITLLQTGGILRQGRFGRSQKFEVSADPLFTEGSEHILFLVDITGDGVHSTGRQLYRIVNPLGRYEVRAQGLLRGPNDKHVDRGVQGKLPKTEKELRQQIQAALAESEGDSSLVN